MGKLSLTGNMPDRGCAGPRGAGDLVACQPCFTLDKMNHLRGQKVMLDADLATLYGVPTKRLNEAVRRNLSRFPESFMFQLFEEEAKSLRSQIATSNKKIT